jgi:hypothetical protein
VALLIYDVISMSCAGACVATSQSVGNTLPAISGQIEIDALESVSGEIDTRVSGPRFPRPHLQFYSGPQCVISEVEEKTSPIRR